MKSLLSSPATAGLRRHCVALAALVACSVLTPGCSVNLQHDKLRSAASTGQGQSVNVSRTATGLRSRVGWGSFTVFAIPIVPVGVEGDGSSRLMDQVRDALVEAGYKANFVQTGGAAVPGKVLTCHVEKFSMYNYTYLFPIVPTWGGIRLKLELVSGGQPIWSKTFSGSGTTLNFFNGYTSASRQSLNQILNDMVAAFSSEEFRRALGHG